MSDRHSSGISLQFIDGTVVAQKPHLMLAHRDDHYIFLFQQSGSVTFMVDFKESTVSGVALHCILPGQVHFFKSSSDTIKGYFLAIDTLLVEEQYRRIFEEEILHLLPLLITAEPAAHLERCMQSLYLLLKEPQEVRGRSVFEHLASAIIGLIADFYIKSEGETYNFNARPTIITRSFKALLKQEYQSNKSPSLYAAKLNISLSYLNECVKSSTGMSVSYWIQYELMLEAKRMLCYSSLTIKEIAYNLGFDDPAYFSRLFTKTAGMSPYQFRKDYHE